MVTQGSNRINKLAETTSIGSTTIVNISVDEEKSVNYEQIRERQNRHKMQIALPEKNYLLMTSC